MTKEIKNLEPYSDEAKAFKMLYSEFYPCNNGFFEDWNDFFNEVSAHHKIKNFSKPDDNLSKFVYGTYKEELILDAYDIVHNACHNLHEDAFDCVGLSDIDKLQKFLDEWLKDKDCTTTYFQDEDVKIRIPWEDYEKYQL